MDDVALADYIAGVNRGPVEAGRVDAQSSRFLGVPCGTLIWFSDYTLIKLQAKHGEINFSHYSHSVARLLSQRQAAAHVGLLVGAIRRRVLCGAQSDL